MRSRRGATSGFTLVELGVALAIFGLLALVSVPAISRYIQDYRLEGTASNLVSDIRLCRHRAIAEANDYIMRVFDQATGDFAKQYHDKANEILLQVARAEPATGSILGAAVERWNDDGSVTVMVATEVTSKSADQKQVYENTNRWTATATREGNQWKISSLLQVI